MVRLSRGELEFIVGGAAVDIRGDGRGVLEFREMTMESAVIASASGSVRLRLGGTDVLVGVKAELGEPEGEKGTEASIHFSVECSGVASMDFEGMGASTLNAELARALERLYKSNTALDRTRLCLLPGRVAWVVYVDVLVLQVDGNLLDAASLAVRQGLRDAVIPRVEAIKGDGDEEDEIEVDDDPSAQIPLAVGDPPVWMSMVQLGSKWVVDATAEEEACMSAKVSIGVNSTGDLCGVAKSGVGAVDWQKVGDVVHIARDVGLKAIEAANKHQKPLKEPVGFFG